MINKKILISAAALALNVNLVLSVNVALADETAAADETALTEECVAPTGTPIVPDGNVASKDELIAAQGAVKNFQAVNLEYLQCLDTKRAALDPESAETAQKLANFDGLEAAAIQMEEKLAEEFNAARTAFMER